MKLLIVFILFYLNTYSFDRKVEIARINSIIRACNDRPIETNIQNFKKIILSPATSDFDKFYLYIIMSDFFLELEQDSVNIAMLDSAKKYGLRSINLDSVEVFNKINYRFSSFYFNKKLYTESNLYANKIVDFNYLSKPAIGEILLHKGYFSLLNKDFKETSLLYDSAYKIMKKAEDSTFLTICFRFKMEFSYYLHNVKDVQKYYDLAVLYANKDLYYLIEANKKYLELVEKSGQFEKALEIQKKVVILENQYDRKARLKNIQLWDNEYKFQLQQLQLTNQQRVNSILKILSIVCIIFIVVSIFGIYNIKSKNKMINSQFNFNNDVLHILIHDIKEPLFGLKALINNMSLKGTYLEEIKKSLNVQLNIINQLMSNIIKLNKFNNFDASINKSDIEAMVHETIQKLNKEAAFKQLDIVFHLTEDLFENLKINIFLFNILFYNLLSNAIKYSHDKSKIEIYFDRNSLCIKDYGVGMNPEVKNKLFKQIIEPKDKSGLGIGLLIIGNLIHNTGIKIDVTSSDPQGTIISISNKE